MYITSIYLIVVNAKYGIYKGRVKTMWIEEIKNSKGLRYKYQERFKNPVTGKNIKLSVTLNKNSKQAQKIALEMLQEKFNQKFITASQQKAEKIQNLTFYDVADEWLEYSKPTIKRSTQILHNCYVNYIKKHTDHELYFNDFTPATAEKILKNLYYNQARSHGYCKAIMTTIKAIMRYAQKSKYIDDITQFEGITIKKRPVTASELEKKNNKYLNKDELEECLSQLYKLYPRVALAMELIALTGLRCGELLALRVQDYDKVNNYISVNGTIRTNERKRTTPKNIYSYRKIFLNDRAKQILDKVILENKQAIKWHSNQYKDKGYIFTTRTGLPIGIGEINKTLKKIQIKDKVLTTHVFRHTHISLLAEMDVPFKIIMQRVGHNNPNTTLKIYTHVTENMNKELQKKLQALSF